MTSMDAYIRVSKKGDRDGEAYMSPALQEGSIRRWARAEQIEVGKVIKDEDVSGGTAVADRGLEELIQRAEEGASAGVIVKDMSRFARETLQHAMAVDRLDKVGARLVGVEDGNDSERPGGRLIMDITAAIAADYRRKVKEGWGSVTRRKIDGGTHLACRAPVGYVRADGKQPGVELPLDVPRDARLVVDPPAADAVRRAFEMRAEGCPYSAITASMEAALGRKFARNTIRSLLLNRAYLGEARSGKHVNRKAHEAIVTAELFAAARNQAGKFHPRDGSLSKQALLVGLVRCASCGGRMGIVGNGPPDARKANYWCAGEDCTDRAYAAVSRVDRLVRDVLVSGSGAEDAAASSQRRYLEAQAAVADCEAKLEMWIEDDEADPATQRRMILKSEKALEASRAALYEMPDSGITGDDSVVWTDGKPEVHTLFGADPDADRRTMRRYIKAVRIGKADPKRRRWQPIEERVEVEWIDGSRPELKPARLSLGRKS